MKPRTLFEKIWDKHLITSIDADTNLLFIDMHLVHEVTSPQAFDSLRISNRKVKFPELTLATVDHGVPTSNRALGIKDPLSKKQIDALEDNCKEFGVTIFGVNDPRQGIVHVIGPEQGITQPGMTIVCGDSHTSTHGAFGALAWGIGTSEVEHVLATQTLIQTKAKNMRIDIQGDLPIGVTAKDIVLKIIQTIGTAGGTGYVIEYTGNAIKSLSMEGRMTVCNMSIEAGARAGLISPDDKTIEYIKGRPLAPSENDYEKAAQYWRSLATDEGAQYDQTISINAENIIPQVTWGTSPEDVVAIDGSVPNPKNEGDEEKRKSMIRALEYMGLEPNTQMKDIKVDKVFIGSCTNGRIEDLRAVSKIADGKRVADHVNAIIVPGSGLVKKQAEEEGLDKIFVESGFEWRDPGCSMCLAMNADKLQPQERCASTSNRNFEGRQGRGGRTHLMSPAMAAAAAINGKLSDCRDL